MMNARADTAEINQQSGISIYTGQVVAIQGSTSLQADKVIIKQDAQHQLLEVIAYGQPAIYKTTPEAGKAELTATALEIHYFPPRHLVQLIEEALVVQDGNRYSAPLINYDIAAQTIHSPSMQNGHTKITLLPATFNQKKPNSPS